MIENKIILKIKDVGEFKVEKGTKIVDILSKDRYDGEPIIAIIENDIKELMAPIEKDSEIELLGINHRAAYSVYARSMVFLLLLAVKELYGEEVDLQIGHAINTEIYGEICIGRELTSKDIKEIEIKMHEISNRDIPIEKIRMSMKEAIEIFERDCRQDKLDLLNYLPEKNGEVTMYKCMDIYDYFCGEMVASTGYLTTFVLELSGSGFLLLLSHKKRVDEVKKRKHIPKLKLAYTEIEKWAKILDTNYVGSINKKIVNDEMKELILVGEGLHEKKISKIADHIVSQKKEKIILVSGPTSSGKTTFSNRLAIQLKVLGKNTHIISADDYFFNREDTPLKKNGEYDFESLKSVDVELLNNDLKKMLKGERVNSPTYNFIEGKREFLGKTYTKNKNDIIIVEGIHGLNDDMTHCIPLENKYKIYVSALTPLNLDRHNSVYVSDVRLLRRLIRDNRTRGNNTTSTLEQWPKVRDGEYKNIFPYQENADVIFNSTILYEMSVLKKYAKPLLEQVPKTDPHHIEARRILKQLSFFRDIGYNIEDKYILGNSIIREFIGGSSFED